MQHFLNILLYCIFLLEWSVHNGGLPPILVHYRLQAPLITFIQQPLSGLACNTAFPSCLACASTMAPRKAAAAAAKQPAPEGQQEAPTDGKEVEDKQEPQVTTARTTSAAASSSAGSADEVNFKCNWCGHSLPASEIHIMKPAGSSGAKDVACCKTCKRVGSRIDRLKLKGDLEIDLNKVNAETRNKLMRVSADLFGEDLKKTVNEHVSATITLKRTQAMKRDGQFELLADAETKWKQDPDVWANILANAERFFCPVRCAEMLAVPTYTLSEHTEITEKDEHGQSVDASHAAKRPKKETSAKPAKTSGNKSSDKPLLPQHVTKLEKAKQKLEDTKFKLTATLMQARGPELADDVPKNHIKKAEDSLASLGKVFEKVSEVQTSNVASTSTLRELQELSKEAVETSAEWCSKLQACIDDAAVAA